MGGRPALVGLLLASLAGATHAWASSLAACGLFGGIGSSLGPGSPARASAFVPALLRPWAAGRPLAAGGSRSPLASPGALPGLAAGRRARAVGTARMAQPAAPPQGKKERPPREEALPPPLEERIQRTFKDVGGGGSAQSPMRLVSYNVLGPVQGLSAKHAYAPREHRYWSYRRRLIFDELDGYKPDVVCLQEVTPDSYKDDFQPFFKERGLTQSYYQPKRHPVGSAEAKREAQRLLAGKRGRSRKTFSHTCLGTATFVRSAAWRVVRSERVVLNTKLHLLAAVQEAAPAEKEQQKTRSVEGLSRRARRRDRGKTKGVPQEVAVSFGGNLKKLADTAVLTLLRPGAGGKEVLVVNVHFFWNPKRPDIKTAQCLLLCRAITQFLGDAPSAALVVCGDMNSVRHLQEEYVKAEALAGRGDGLSGVWTVLSQGGLSASHPEHPAAFGTSPQLQDVASGLPALRNAYESHSMYPEATTKTDSFAGTIDHIWCSSEVDVLQLLEMPFGKGEVPTLPNAVWGSDHLAIGATLNVK